MTLEPKKIKSVTVSTFPLLFAMKWWDLYGKSKLAKIVMVKLSHPMASRALAPHSVNIWLCNS